MNLVIEIKKEKNSTLALILTYQNLFPHYNLSKRGKNNGFALIKYPMDAFIENQ